MVAVGCLVLVFWLVLGIGCGISRSQTKAVPGFGLALGGSLALGWGLGIVSVVCEGIRSILRYVTLGY